MAIKKVQLAQINVQDGEVHAKIVVNTEKTAFVSTFVFDIQQCPEIANSALALDHDIRCAVHEALGIDAPEFVPLPSKIAAPN